MPHKMGQQSDPKGRASLPLSEGVLTGFTEGVALTEPSQTHTQRHGTIERSGHRFLALFQTRQEFKET